MAHARYTTTIIGALAALAALTLLPATPALADTPAPADLDELRVRIEALLDESPVPGAIVTIVEDNTVVMAEGFGFANIDRDVPMTAETIVRVGSLSKNLTTLAAMKLAAAGQLDIDSPMRALAPEVALDNPWEPEHPLTLRHLLGHTAGIEGSTPFEYATSELNVEPSDYAREMAPKVSVRWPPGFFFSYANPGHTLAAVAIENACGCAFDTYMEQTIFAELGMPDTSFRLTPQSRQRLAASYTADGSREQAEWLMAIRPSGSLLSTAADLGRLIAFYAGPRTGEDRLVPDDMLYEMERTQASASGRLAVNSAGYGLGTFAFSPGNGHVMYGHAGSTEGFKTWLGYDAGNGAGFAVVINGEDGGLRWQFVSLLGQYVMRDRTAPAPATLVGPDATQLQPLTGWYAPFTHDMKLRSGIFNVLGVVNVAMADDGLQVSPLLPFSSSSVLRPTGDTVFREGDYPLPTVAFVDDHEGRTVMVRGDAYERVSAFRAVGRVALVALTTVVTLIAIVVVLVQLARRSLGRAGTGLPLAGPVAIAGICWLAIYGIYIGVALLSSMDRSTDIGTVSLTSVTLLAVSVLGPLFSVLALRGAFTLAGPGGWKHRIGAAGAGVMAAGWLLLFFAGWVPLITFAA